MECNINRNREITLLLGKYAPLYAGIVKFNPPQNELWEVGPEPNHGGNLGIKMRWKVSKTGRTRYLLRLPIPYDRLKDPQA